MGASILIISKSNLFYELERIFISRFLENF